MADDPASSGPALSDRLSITALAISLVALIIGTSSFLQAILGTAEGYRRCAWSVIGPWSKLRRRVFKWSEFRLETKFRAPLIQVLTTQELELALAGEYPGNIYLLNEKNLDTIKQSSRTWDDWLHRRWDPAYVLKETLHFFDHKDLQSKANSKTDLSTAKILVTDTLGDGLDVFQRLKKTTSKEKQAKKAAVPDTFFVSWIRLMHELHVVCEQYWPNEVCCSHCASSDGPQQYKSELAASLLKESEQEFYGRQWISSPRTHITVKVQEISWDFMPADVTRPLASSTLSNVVLLSLRLGMQWRTLDRARSQLSADGNGRSITSTDIRGLGMVLKFSTTGRFDSSGLDIIPSRAADRLMCGIIPGDPDLVRREFHLINMERKLVQLWEPQGVFSQIGLTMPNSHTLELYDRCTHNEVITLLCSFLPLAGSNLRGFKFSGWKRRRYTTFHFFESRLKFLTALHDQGDKRSKAMEYVYVTLKTLSTDFKAEYYDGYVKDEFAVDSSSDRLLKLTESCARVFRETTRYFMKENYHVQPPRAPSTWYMQLVAAHARLSANAELKVPSSAKGLSQGDIPEEIHNLLEAAGVESSYFALPLWLQTEGYINGVDNDEYGIVQYMQGRGFKRDAKEIQDAWWMLMLRGVAWDLSCDDRVYPGEPVPSSYGSDKTPVWFT